MILTLGLTFIFFSVFLIACAEIRQTNILLDPNDIPKAYTKNPCTIKTVMDEAENQMKNYLRGKTLRWLSDHVVSILPDDQIEATKEWFNK